MAQADVVRWGGDRLRVGPWRGDAHVAYIAPVQGRPPPSATGVQHCLDVLKSRGYRGAVTAALATGEVAGFLSAGFAVRERLHLLVHRLGDLDDMPSTIQVRRAKRQDRAAALAVDGRAFSPFWRLDEAGLDDAIAATPTARFRVTAPDIVGYAVTGRAGRRGYVQRLAVDPDRQRQGLGSALVLDGLRWLRRWSATDAVVNTQETNTGALALYEALGFRRQREGLIVLEIDVP
jgi:ribosomal protein S18 acetylase RimI-like enzyme